MPELRISIHEQDPNTDQSNESLGMQKEGYTTRSHVSYIVGQFGAFGIKVKCRDTCREYFDLLRKTTQISLIRDG